MPDKRKDHETRAAVDAVEASARRQWRAIWLLTIGLVVVLAWNGNTSRQRANDNARQVKQLKVIVGQINESRFENTYGACLERTTTNSGLRRFVLYVSDADSPLYLRAVKEFPVKDRAQCEQEAREKIKPPIERVK